MKFNEISNVDFFSRFLKLFLAIMPFPNFYFKDLSYSLFCFISDKKIFFIEFSILTYYYIKSENLYALLLQSAIAIFRVLSCNVTLAKFLFREFCFALRKKVIYPSLF